MELNEIGLRDPFILLNEGKYYLYGTRNATTWGEADGFDVYVSEDLKEWEGPIEIFHNNGSFWATHNYWAPECIKYQGKFYLIATFGSPKRKKGVQLLVSDFPDGTFMPLTDEPITPPQWNCLDGTIYFEQGQPWLVFSHGLPEEPRGAVCAMRLTKDLSEAAEEPVVLFYADTAPWSIPIPFAKEEFGIDGEVYFSDGPYLFKRNDRLFMIWSSWGQQGYSIGLAESSSQTISGPWQHMDRELLSGGGHGMIFSSKEGKNILTIHSPNEILKERPVFLSLDEHLKSVIL